jgi:hypothetical protein
VIIHTGLLRSSQCKFEGAAPFAFFAKGAGFDLLFVFVFDSVPDLDSGFMPATRLEAYPTTPSTLSSQIAVTLKRQLYGCDTRVAATQYRSAFRGA